MIAFILSTLLCYYCNKIIFQAPVNENITTWNRLKIKHKAVVAIIGYWKAKWTFLKTHCCFTKNKNVFVVIYFCVGCWSKLHYFLAVAHNVRPFIQEQVNKVQLAFSSDFKKNEIICLVHYIVIVAFQHLDMKKYIFQQIV